MEFKIETFLHDVNKLGKLQSITYDNGVEALDILKELTTTTDAQRAFSSNDMFLKVGKQLANKDKAFGFMIGKVNKGLKAYYRFNLIAFLLKNGKLVLYSPYNDIVSLVVSGGRKMTFNGKAEELYTATIDEIFKNSGGRNEGIPLYATYNESYSWDIPSNALETHHLLFTHVKEDEVNIDSCQFEGILVN